ncbi:MAG TPA: ATP-binding protein, partial [Candidatus Limnocylindrales bacterium]|nr:ATP-binding protein [Candidatus Limnocylindrales bacterium]
VLQEALHNAAKHSGASHFEVELRATDDEIRLTVSDEGVGFDPGAALRTRGIGLVSMQERLHLVQGKIEIESAPNRGTSIHARVPLRAAG